MNPLQAQNLNHLFSEDYLVIINSGSYVDSPVKDIRKSTQEDVDDSFGDNLVIGEWVYDSEVYSSRPLREISLRDVKVYKEIELNDNFEEIPLGE